MQICSQLNKKSYQVNRIFLQKNTFDLLYQQDIHENVISKENIESEKSNNINEHQTPFTIKSGT